MGEVNTVTAVPAKRAWYELFGEAVAGAATNRIIDRIDGSGRPIVMPMQPMLFGMPQNMAMIGGLFLVGIVVYLIARK